MLVSKESPFDFIINGVQHVMLNYIIHIFP